MLDMLQDITTQRCKDWGGELMEFNGQADQVHALVSLPPNLGLSRFVNNIKTTSSHLVRREYARQLSRVYRKPAILLHHLVRRRAAVGDQAVRGAAKGAGLGPRAARGGLHPQPSAARSGWSTGRRSGRLRRCRPRHARPSTGHFRGGGFPSPGRQIGV